MNAKRCYILAGIVIFLSLIICGIFSVFKNIKVDDFKPAFFAILIDSSVSNTKLDAQKTSILQHIF